MSFQSLAQEQEILIVQSPDDHIEVVDQSDMVQPSEEVKDDLVVMEHDSLNGKQPFEIISDNDSPIEVDELILDELPGAPNSPDPIEVEETEIKAEEDSDNKDDNEAKDKKPKKNEKWDWESKGAEGFLMWIKERFASVPKHSGYDSSGIQRATAYLEKLDDEISKAMRLDIDGELDSGKVEEVRYKIDEGIERLYERLDKVQSGKKRGKKKKKADEEFTFVKEAQKITGVQGIYVVAPLFISRIARLCINGTVSAGHAIEDIYSQQVKKWKLTDREQAETMQLLSDMGYTLRQDRGYMPDEDVDESSSDNFDWGANYRG